MRHPLNKKSPILHKSDFPKAMELTVDLARTHAVLIILFFVIGFALNQYLEWLGQILATSDQGPWPAQIAEFLAGLIEGFFLLMIGTFYLANQRTRQTWKEFNAKYLGPLTAESLRALAYICGWSLLFLVPGFIMYARLSVLPFVIVLDPEYDENPDGVKISREMTKHFWVQVSLLTLVLALVGGAFEIAPNLLHIEDLFLRAIFELANFIVSLFAFFLLYCVYDNLKARKGNV
jgi:hypothetical protein